MKKTRVLILGGGISGLALAWYLAKREENEIILLEKSDRLGGHLETDISSGYLFEKGPRTFKASRCPDLLELVEELGLQDEVIFSDKGARSRYIWNQGRLVKAPSWGLLKQILIPLLREWSIKPHLEDESVWDFACRRFNPRVAELLFDPLVLGIHAGDVRALSMQSCFPGMKRWEAEYGSLTKGFFANCLKKKLPGLFSFKTGTNALVQALSSRIRGQIVLNQEIVELNAEAVEVKTQDRLWKGDYIFSALPLPVCGNIFMPLQEKKLKAQSVTVVNLGYSEEVLHKKGFGYLVPTCENENVLGVVFDSLIFPQQNRRAAETRLTVMMRGEASVEGALHTLERHLGIKTAPEVVLISQKEEAIPQYELGHGEKVQLLQSRLLEEFPRFKLLGNYLCGASVNDCIAFAKSCAEGLNG